MSTYGVLSRATHHYLAIDQLRFILVLEDKLMLILPIIYRLDSIYQWFTYSCRIQEIIDIVVTDNIGRILQGVAYSNNFGIGSVQFMLPREFLMIWNSK